jgi:hypothetical protein
MFDIDIARNLYKAQTDIDTWGDFSYIECRIKDAIRHGRNTTVIYEAHFSVVQRLMVHLTDLGFKYIFFDKADGFYSLVVYGWN